MRVYVTFIYYRAILRGGDWGLSNVEIPLANAFWKSGLVCDRAWYANPGPIDLETLRLAQIALNEGRNFLAADTDTYGRAMKEDALLNPGDRKIPNPGREYNFWPSMRRSIQRIDVSILTGASAFRGRVKNIKRCGPLTARSPFGRTPIGNPGCRVIVGGGIQSS